MARQFYGVNLTKDTSQTLIFEFPVRKLIISVQGFVGMQIGSTVLPAQHFTLQDAVVELDFQSGNTGNGVKTITFVSYTSQASVTCSVSEYGNETAGDDSYFNTTTITSDEVVDNG